MDANEGQARADLTRRLALACQGYAGIGPTGVPAKWCMRERDGYKMIVDVGTADPRGVIAKAETWLAVFTQLRGWALIEAGKALRAGHNVAPRAALGALIMALTDGES